MNSWIAYAAIAISGLIIIGHILVFAYLLRNGKKPAPPSEKEQTPPPQP